VILTKANTPRATEPGVLVEYFLGKKTRITSTVKEAVALARDEAEMQDLILVTGSLFVVGQAREVFYG
jgi:folylpolyglutamate synthase/dihydropteroate synthase